MICEVQYTVHRIPHQNVNDIATTVQISYASCHAIFIKDLMTSQSAAHVVPHPLKEMLHQTGRKIFRISIQLWMIIPHSYITSLPMTRHGVSCTTRKSMVSQLGDIPLHPCSARTSETHHCFVTTPAIFSKPVLFKLFCFHIPLSQYQTCTCTTRYCKY